MSYHNLFHYFHHTMIKIIVSRYPLASVYLCISFNDNVFLWTSRREPGVRIREISGTSTSSQVSTSSLSLTTPSPSQSPNFFSKFLRRSDPKGKSKSGPAGLKDADQVSKEEMMSQEYIIALIYTPSSTQCSQIQNVREGSYMNLVMTCQPVQFNAV